MPDAPTLLTVAALAPDGTWAAATPAAIRAIRFTVALPPGTSIPQLVMQERDGEVVVLLAWDAAGTLGAYSIEVGARE